MLDFIEQHTGLIIILVIAGFIFFNNSESKLDRTRDYDETSFEEEDEDVETYILNKNTKKFHYTWCYSVNQMKESNKKYYTGTRMEVIEMGYVPCGNCHP